jgi:thiol-disulfide isomerase/thioredoxin
MSKLLSRKSISNIIFVIACALLIYAPSREWFMRQIAFAPSIIKIDKSEKLLTYNWKLRGLNTENINFNELESKVVFVNFWATWCPPCRAEMPMIQKLFNEYQNDVAFIFVTTENWSTVEQFFNEHDYDLPVYNSIGLPPDKFAETNSIPASYLIDKEGNILISKVGVADWNSSKVRNLLDKLLK